MIIYARQLSFKFGVVLSSVAQEETFRIRSSVDFGRFFTGITVSVTKLNDITIFGTFKEQKSFLLLLDTYEPTLAVMIKSISEL